MVSDLLQASLRFLGWTAFVLLAAAAPLCAIVTIIMLSSLLSALLWGAATVVSGAAAVLVFRTLRASRREMTAQQNGQPWDASIRATLAKLPPNSEVRRSVAGEGSMIGTRVLAGLLWLIGLIAALAIGFATDPTYPDHLDGAIALFLIGGALAITGVAAGALLSIGRDRRGRSVQLWAAAVLPIGLGLVVMLGGGGPGTSDGNFVKRVVTGLAVMPLTGVAPIAGFSLARRLSGFRQSANEPQLPADLARAIAHGRADALIRHYPGDEAGLAYLDEDEALLSGVGYQKVATDHLDVSVTQTLIGETPRVAALFVRQSART